MADDTVTDLWSEETGIVIGALEQSILQEYGISLTDLLTNPASYASKNGIAQTVENIRKEANDYINGLRSNMQKEKEDLEKDGLKCDSLTKQLAQAIAMRAKQDNIPLIKPQAIDRGSSIEETIYVNDADSGINALIGRLSANSNFVADFSTTYSTYSLGQWLFDGQKNYMIVVALQPNPLIDLDTAENELGDLFDNVDSYMNKGAQQ